MKVTMKILRISAGIIDDNKMLYANAIILDDTVANQIDNDRIDVGQQHAKVKISTEDNNVLSRALASSGLVPGDIQVDVKTTVKSGGITMEIIGFDSKKVAA
jgi:hypothetical protein